ncbi:MAG: ANTAR domain-containing response regulator [Rhizobiaceae bacterium]
MNSSDPPRGLSGNTADSLHKASSAPPRSVRAPVKAMTGLRQSTVLLAHPQNNQGEALLREVRRTGCRVEAAWPPPVLPPLGFDFAIVAIDTEALMATPWLSGAPPVPVVAVVDGDKGLPDDVLRLSNAQAVLVKPCQPAAILINLALAKQIFNYERRLLNKVAKLEETLHATRHIEQAKLILMQQRKLRAHEAYDYLRQQAMSKQKSVAAISAALVDAHGLMD